MRAVFRVDASLHIGTGHVMRCLVLADQLRTWGAECHFVSREHPGHLGALVVERGHGLSLLPPASPTPAPVGYAAWLGVDPLDDARQTLDAVPATGTDWLIVDHYALDAAWEEPLRATCRRLLVIDDLANRPHKADLLLDQNLGRTPQHYSGLLPATARVLTGPYYALMRDDFAKWRERALTRRRQLERPARWLISLGGVDADNISGQMLDLLVQGAANDIVSLDVVLGRGSPHQEAVGAAMREWCDKGQLHVGTAHMARLVAEADVAIGAAGVSAWERCALGLPSLIVLQAENQRPGAEALVAAGAALWLGRPQEINRTWPGAWTRVRDAQIFQKMQDCAAAIADGRGTQRVASIMTGMST